MIIKFIIKKVLALVAIFSILFFMHLYQIAQVTEKTACINLNNRQLRITTLAQRVS